MDFRLISTGARVLPRTRVNGRVPASRVIAPARPDGRRSGPPRWPLVVEHDTQQGTVDFDSRGTALDEAQPLELLQEATHADAGRPDHVGERRVRDPGQNAMRLVL